MHEYESKLLEICNANENVMIVTAETRFNMRELPDKLGPRFLDVGISEQSMIGIAAGLSKLGKIPICHALAAFLTLRPFEFIRTDLGYPNLKSILVGSFNGFLSQANGPTHQAIDDVGLMRLVPNMQVFAPSSLDEMLFAFDNVDNLSSPIYIRYNDSPRLYDLETEWLSNQQVKSGSDFALLSYGNMSNICFEVVNQLESKKISGSFYNMRFLEPFDKSFFEKIANKYDKLIIVEDHFAKGGLSNIVKENLFENDKRPECLFINLKDNFFSSGLLEDILVKEGFDAQSLEDRIETFLNKI